MILYYTINCSAVFLRKADSPVPKAKATAKCSAKAKAKAKATAKSLPRNRKTRKDGNQKTPAKAAKGTKAKKVKAAAAATAKAKAKAKAKGSPKKVKELKMDVNNVYSRAYHAAKRQGKSVEEVGLTCFHWNPIITYFSSDIHAGQSDWSCCCGSQQWLRSRQDGCDANSTAGFGKKKTAVRAAAKTSQNHPLIHHGLSLF